jgi:hypothetical protein
MRINPNSNSIKQQQQQILLKYKIRQNEIMTNKHSEPIVTNNKNVVNTATMSSETTNNGQKLAFIKSKIKSEYANLYHTK